MRQGQGDGAETRTSQTCDWSHESERQRSTRAPGTPRAREAQPTPLPRVNFTLLGMGPYAAPRSSVPPPVPRARQQVALEAESAAASDAELDALLRQVDVNVERTLELDARPVRPPWIRRRRRRSILAGMVLYLAVGSASFLWFASRSRRPAPADESAPTPPEPVLAATAPMQTLPAAAASTRSAQPAAQPASAAAPKVRPAERRATANKKTKRAKLLASRAKRKKRVARAVQAR